MSRLSIYPIEHRQERRIALEYDSFPGKELDQITRSLPGRKYSATRKLWHIPHHNNYKSIITQAFKDVSQQVSLIFKESGIPAPSQNISS